MDSHFGVGARPSPTAVFAHDFNSQKCDEINLLAMPLAHNLLKVSKSVSKSKGSIHVKGRNFKRLNRASLRHEKLTNRKQKHLEQKQNELMVVKYLQEEVKQVPEKEVFGLDDMKAYLENFISRFDGELEELRAARRPGRPASSRQQILEEKVKYDQGIYATGYKIPDISDKLTVNRLREWNGTIGGVTAFKFVYVSKDMEQLPIKEQEMS